MNAFRYLAAAIAASLNGAYTDAGKIFAYAIKEADAKSLMSQLAEFAIENHVASKSRPAVSKQEAEELLNRILRQPASDQLIPPAYDPQRGDVPSLSNGPGVGQETMQDIPQDRVFDFNNPVPRSQVFDVRGEPIKQNDPAEMQRNKAAIRDGSGGELETEEDSSAEFGDTESSDDEVNKQTGDGYFSIVDVALENEEQKREQAMSSTKFNVYPGRQQSRLARAITVSLSAAEDTNTMNHDANADRSDWIDENDLITGKKPVRVNTEVLDELSADSSDGSSDKINVLSESFVADDAPDDIFAERAQGLEPEEDDPSEDDVDEPDEDIPGVDSIPASFTS